MFETIHNVPQQQRAMMYIVCKNEYGPQLAPERPYAILIEAMWMLISSRGY